MARKIPPTGDEDGPSVDEVTAQVMTWVSLSMRLAHARPMADSLGALNELGLTMPQVVALHIIAFEGPTTMTRVVERVGLSTSAVSALLHRLVEMGLCERRDDPLDRRQRSMRPTAAGQEVIKKLLQSRLRDTRGSIEPLSPPTRRRLGRVLTAVIEELTAATQLNHAPCRGDLFDPLEDLAGADVGASKDTSGDAPLPKPKPPKKEKS